MTRSATHRLGWSGTSERPGWGSSAWRACSSVMISAKPCWNVESSACRRRVTQQCQRRQGDTGGCVKVALLLDGGVVLRDSSDRDGQINVYTASRVSRLRQGCA